MKDKCNACGEEAELITTQDYWGDNMYLCIKKKKISLDFLYFCYIFDIFFFTYYFLFLTLYIKNTKNQEKSFFSLCIDTYYHPNNLGLLLTLLLRRRHCIYLSFSFAISSPAYSTSFS